MYLSQQIQTHRKLLGLSQEALATKIYVSRQTISNWETGRSYPDVENLLLLSVLFDLSLDELVKGDVKMMKESITNVALTRLGKQMIGFSLAAILSLGPSLFLPSPWWVVAPIVLWGLAMVAATRIERLKKRANVQTYKEVLTLLQGGDVATVRRLRNRRKDRWAKALLVLGFAAVAAVLTVLVMLPYLLSH
ncbi:helix-turn-helix transcriptional regulator [Lacticaseibacillus daqingensis]|uniref:helix-turn-helix transcriptional regulator n=1 Tax=Lacticaseibacillus daqingensis TaxID=2486014 RepID=UPI000F77F3CD|nr:helix-turn-helix transcriptional regulator [Lacticaseibacillus daqingensis]